MLTLQDLELLIKTAAWFSRLGEPDISREYVRIPNLRPWSGEEGGDEGLVRIADEMDWLPSSRDEDDPVHGRSLEERSEALGKRQEFSLRVLKTYKTTLSALGSFEGHPALRIGPHDFTEAARGAALFAARRAAYEMLLEEPDFWCRIMRVYHAGHWPCGILRNATVIVL